MSRLVVLDLASDPRCREVAVARGAVHVNLATTRAWAGTGEAVVIDARGRHEDGVDLLARLTRPAGATTVFVTDRISPGDHKAVWLAGATRIIVLGLSEPFDSALGELEAG